MNHTQGDRLNPVLAEAIPPGRVRLARRVTLGATAALAAVAGAQTVDALGWVGLGLGNWRPTLYALLLWAVAFCWARAWGRGEAGRRDLFVLPAFLFTLAMSVFPLLFALVIAFSDWNLASAAGRRFNGLDNLRQMWGDPFYWGALRNMVWYVLAVLVEYAVAFGLALMLAADIRGRKFWRVCFLLPLMLSPVAVSWMIGKSMMEARFGPLAALARGLGWETPSFFGDPAMARAAIMLMDAWSWIPFMTIMLLAGLQALDREVQEAAKVDGATGWQAFWQVTFPLMLPVSVTAIAIRVIFKLKLADLIINVTAGGPGGATDSVTSFIFREYRDRSNVGYGTMLAIVYLVLIILFMTALLAGLRRLGRRSGT